MSPTLGYGDNDSGNDQSWAVEGHSISFLVSHSYRLLPPHTCRTIWDEEAGPAVWNGKVSATSHNRARGLSWKVPWAIRPSHHSGTGRLKAGTPRYGGHFPGDLTEEGVFLYHLLRRAFGWGPCHKSKSHRGLLDRPLKALWLE